MELRCQQLLDRANIGTFEMSMAGRLLDCNDACARILGFESRSDLLDKSTLPFVHNSDLEMILSSMGELEKIHSAEVHLTHVDGSTVWTNQNLLYSTDEEDRGVIHGTMIDVTESRSTVWELEHQAQHDPLTGLPNRSMVLARLTVALTSARRSKNPVAAIVFDIDQLDQIVDEHGEGAGDKVISEIAARLHEQARISDIVGRYSHNQLIVILSDCDEDLKALSVANRMLAAVARPIELATESYEVTSSAGIALFPEDARTPEKLAENACLAAKQAGEEGGNACRLFEQTRNDAAFERAFLVSSIGSAIDSGQFSLRYQPTIDVRTGKIEVLETSVRWLHPRMGLLEPWKFMPLLDRLEASVRLGHWIVAEASRQLREWRNLGLETPRIAINLSTAQMESPTLGSFLQDAVEDASLSPEAFQIEVSESILGSRPRTMMLTSELTERGFSVAIDQFGTGGCSIVDLKHLNASTLKLDSSFVNHIDDGHDELGIVSGMMTMGRALGKQVVADGVKTRKQLMALRSLDCALMQGDYLGVPLPANETSDLLQMQH